VARMFRQARYRLEKTMNERSTASQAIRDYEDGYQQGARDFLTGSRPALNVLTGEPNDEWETGYFDGWHGEPYTSWGA